MAIQGQLRRCLFLATLSFFSASFIVAAYLAFKQKRADESRHQAIVNKTLLELITPALKISDYAEVERILHLISNGETIYAVVPNKATMILSDYTNLPILSGFTAADGKISILDCDAIKANWVKFRGSNWLATCNNIAPRGDLLKNPRSIGMLLSFYRYRPFANLFERFLYLILFFIVTALISLALLRRSVWKTVVTPLEVLAQSIRQRASMGSGLPLKLEDSDDTSSEIREIYASFNDLLRIIADHSQRRQQAEKTQALNQLSLQVAHDIRSPLAALDSVLKDVSQLPEDKRVIIRSAAGRIRDIANNLIEKNRELESAAVSVQLLSSLIDPLISEKRLQFRSRIGVEIYSRIGAQSYGLFAKVQPGEFKRMLSNIINNAVEALGERGSVKVLLSVDQDKADAGSRSNGLAIDGVAGGWILLKVQDNGKGIPESVLPKLAQRGATHDKLDGSGLGLHHAKTTVESWGGTLEIQSVHGNGATVILRLPQVRPPDWFVSTLAISPNSRVVVLDDDTSIHQVWRGRFDSMRVKEKGIEILHFSIPTELRAWVRNNKIQSRTALYLMDYELLAFKDTGLTLAEELGLGPRTVLVTSRYEEPGILDGCRKIGARMIPKGLAGLVPIRIVEAVLKDTQNLGSGDAEQRASAAEPHPWDAVLIDDDPLARMIWKTSASRSGKRFLSFSTVSEFLQKAGTIHKQTPVYVDVQLADGVKGDQESLRIHELGFTEIYLATGHEADAFSALKHLRGVVGKDPPWPQMS